YSEQRKVEIPQSMLAWSDEQRAEFAYALLMTVPASTLSALTQRLTPLLVRDFLAELPVELALRVLEFADFETLCNASLVSRRWRQLCLDQSLWKRLFLKSGWYYNRKLIRGYLGLNSTLVTPYWDSRPSQTSCSQMLNELAIEMDGLDVHALVGVDSTRGDPLQGNDSFYGDRQSPISPHTRLSMSALERAGLSPPTGGLPLSRQNFAPNTERNASILKCPAVGA
ncbi:hypothetical protein L0F63_005184, partial [Massospora cicadina]